MRSSESSTPELFCMEETGNAVQVTKCLHLDDNSAHHKKVKFSDTVSITSFLVLWPLEPLQVVIQTLMGPDCNSTGYIIKIHDVLNF